MLTSGHAVRITHPYELVQRIIQQWSSYCQRIVCYEHDDDGANNIHCHLHLEEVRCSVKNLQTLAKASGVPLMFKKDGSQRATSLMSFRSKEYDKHPSGYAYLTKGKYEAKYLQGFTKEDTDAWKASWVIPANHINRSRDNILYDKFMESGYKHVKIDFQTIPDDKLAQLMKNKDLVVQETFDDIKSHASAWLRREYKNRWSRAFGTELRGIVINYCWNNDVAIPKDYKI